jgi:transposase
VVGKWLASGGWNYHREVSVWRISERKNSEAFLAFLKHLMARTAKGSRLVLVMDNAGYHRARKVQRFLHEHAGRLEPFWLPPCGPALNLTDCARGYLKETATNNYFSRDVERMESAAAHACQLSSRTGSPMQGHLKAMENSRSAA